MQDLDSLAIFVRIAEMASFTHAAESLGIQKGRASNVVRRIEAAMGVRLLHRSTRTVQLTEDGRAFYNRARALLADAEELNSMFAGSKTPLRGGCASICPPNWPVPRSCPHSLRLWPPILKFSWRYRVPTGVWT